MGCTRWILSSFLVILLIFETILSSKALAVGLGKHHKGSKKPVPGFTTNQPSCDIFTGTWVRDDTYQSYQPLGCPIIDPEFNCLLYGRSDTDYLRYQWKPLNCDLPKFDGLNFLTKMRGKTVMFVGDSLGRNQWESLICMVHASVPQSATQMSSRDPLYTYKFLVWLHNYVLGSLILSLCLLNLYI
jgi:GDSL/SGNH-like Acyl-Esterase family found in Pmr5 and Cas1p/PMR5 N terminal Domain